MPESAKAKLPNELLQYARTEKNWSQLKLAKELTEKLTGEVVNENEVSRWERGVIKPFPYRQNLLAELFKTTVQRLGFTRAGKIPFWDVPYSQPDQSGFFMSREDYLLNLHSLVALRNQQYTSDGKKPNSMNEYIALQPQALVGLGGIGKTQIAIEYAYRYAREYQTVIWLRARHTEVLTSDFANIATTVNLPEKGEAVARCIMAVKEWLMHFTRWLLIFDDAEEVEVIRDFLPQKCFGHIIVTTRSAATGKLAQAIEVEKIPLDAATTFLLRRSKAIGSEMVGTEAAEETHAQARYIAQFIADGLPLMLEQAGAYIEATGCGLAGYITDYETQGVLLRQKPKLPEAEYPYTVATAWLMSFKKVREASPVAADLLSLFAFLDSDAIPEEMFIKAASTLGPVLSVFTDNPTALNDAMAVLRKYSLVKRYEAMKTCSIHSLVQAVIQDNMDKVVQRQWVERCICAVRQIHTQYSNPGPFQEKYHSHIFACSVPTIKLEIMTVEAGWLLNQFSRFLLDAHHFGEAEVFLKRALSIWAQNTAQKYKNTLEDRLETMTCLAWMFYRQMKFAQAESNFKDVIYIRSQELGLEHPQVADAIYGYADVLRLGRKAYKEAEQLYKHLLAIFEKTEGKESLRVAEIMGSLALVYFDAGDYHEAESLLKRSLTIIENLYGPDHYEVATCLLRLANVNMGLNRYREAMRCHERLMMLRKTEISQYDPLYIETLVCLAIYYRRNDRLRAAELVLKRAISLRGNIPREYAILMQALNQWFLVLIGLNKIVQAEWVVDLLLKFYTDNYLGAEDTRYIDFLKWKALLCAVQEKYQEAYDYQRAAFDSLLKLTGTSLD